MGSCLQCALGVVRLGAKSGAMRLPWRRAGQAGAAGGAHSRGTIADVLLKESWVAGSFFGCELYCSVEYRVYTIQFTVLVVRLSFWL